MAVHQYCSWGTSFDPALCGVNFIIIKILYIKILNGVVVLKFLFSYYIISRLLWWVIYISDLYNFLEYPSALRKVFQTPNCLYNFII